MGSAGHAVPREATGRNGAAALTCSFNQTALHARSAERREKANAENALARQRQGMHGPDPMSVSGEHQRQSHTWAQQNEDVQQCLLRGAAAWAIGRVGQKPSDAFNGSAAQQLLRVESNSDAASTDDSTELDSQGIEGRDLRWWLRGWLSWHQEEDRRLSGCTDFDAMYFARTRRVRLGGAWGCVLAWMRGTQTMTHATLDMIQATFRLAGTACEQRTPGTIASGRDAQQMSDSSSGSGTGTGSGKLGENRSDA